MFKNKIADEVVSKERRPGGVEFPEIAPVSVCPSLVPNHAELTSLPPWSQLVSGARGKTVYETGDSDAGVWSASGVMGLIDDIPSCAELLSRMEKDAERVILENAKLVKRESKL